MRHPTKKTAPANPEPSPAALVRFNFHGDELDVATTADGQHYVVLARLCEPLELRVDGQTEKLRALPWAVTQKIWVTDPRGVPHETVCLALRSVAGWLFTINAGKVAPHLREKLALYQRECADVLADHFLGKRADGDPQTALLTRLTATIEALHARVESLESRPVANLDRPALGAGAARLHVLNPLREIAAIEARAAKREGDKRALASLRLLAENDLRARLGFTRNGGQSWDRFPHARLGDLHCALVSLFHAARRRADILTPTATQLRLIKQA